MRRRHVILWTVILVVVMLVGWAVREGRTAVTKYPSRPIQMVIPYSPGSTDLILRPFMEYIPQYLGQQMIFVYKPGAAGSTGANFLVKSKPDGYTLIAGPMATFTTAQLTMDVDYTIDDFAPVCRLTSGILGIAVKADSPFKTVKDLIEAAKKAPGKVTYSTPGVCTPQHIAMFMLAREAGITLTHVPTAGGGPTITAALGGHVSMATSAMAPVTPHVKSGALRLLVIFEEKRTKEFPDVPTLVEAGFPQIVFATYTGVLAPEGTPKEVINTVSGAFKKVADEHRSFIEDRVEKLGVRLDFGGPEDYNKALRLDHERIKAVLKDLNMETTK